MMMDINKLYSDKRTGESDPDKDLKDSEDSKDPRSEYQRDFDRIIFSSAFRRLQNKTQIFPLPGSVFVHNRLTHSLEVASVGRSLGKLVGKAICDKKLEPDSKEFYEHALHDVIAAACLCHDIGNPAFGHAGEDAIAHYFVENETDLKNEEKFEQLEDSQWIDLINFEGNANAIRVLTQQQKGKSEGGLKLTYSTLVAIMKYPCEANGKYKPPKKEEQVPAHRKKFGFFQSEKETFNDIAAETNMLKADGSPLIYYRHPFVWLVEAADDICYNIVDFEDAHRLRLVKDKNIEEFEELVCSLYVGQEKIKERINDIKDQNEKISYLRAKAINALIKEAVRIYTDNFDSFLKGGISERPIFEIIKEQSKSLQAIVKFVKKEVYTDRNVIEIENAGYHVLYELLAHFIPPILKINRTNSDEKALQLLPQEFNYDGEIAYKKVLGVLDYVSGMTDNYATDLYKRIKGIEIGMRI